jgi:hypothetical protein
LAHLSLLSFSLFFNNRWPTPVSRPNNYSRPATPLPLPLSESPTPRSHSSASSSTSRRRRLLPTWPIASPPPRLPRPFPLPSTELRVNAQCPAHEPPRPSPPATPHRAPPPFMAAASVPAPPLPCHPLLFPLYPIKGSPRAPLHPAPLLLPSPLVQRRRRQSTVHPPEPPPRSPLPTLLPPFRVPR